MSKKTAMQVYEELSKQYKEAIDVVSSLPMSAGAKAECLKIIEIHRDTSLLTAKRVYRDE